MRKCFTVLIIAAVIMCMTGCADNKAENTEEKIIHITDNEAADVIPVEITVVNMCGADIGMFAMIDPGSGEQINVDSIGNGESITIGVNWPCDETELQWALYNEAGELCIEATSDLTAITKSATIIVSGDGDAETVKLQVE